MTLLYAKNILLNRIQKIMLINKVLTIILLFSSIINFLQFVFASHPGYYSQSSTFKINRLTPSELTRDELSGFLMGEEKNMEPIDRPDLALGLPLERQWSEMVVIAEKRSMLANQPVQPKEGTPKIIENPEIVEDKGIGNDNRKAAKRIRSAKDK
jgi:hypothetical protein